MEDSPEGEGQASAPTDLSSGASDEVGWAQLRRSADSWALAPCVRKRTLAPRFASTVFLIVSKEKAVPGSPSILRQWSVNVGTPLRRWSTLRSLPPTE